MAQLLPDVTSANSKPFKASPNNWCHRDTLRIFIAFHYCSWRFILDVGCFFPWTIHLGNLNKTYVMGPTHTDWHQESMPQYRPLVTHKLYVLNVFLFLFGLWYPGLYQYPPCFSCSALCVFPCQAFSPPPTTTRWKKWLLITEVLPKKGTAEMIHQPIGSNIFIGSHILGGRSSKNSASIHITRRSSRDLGDKFSKNSHSKTKKLSDAMKSRAYQLS